jgi:DNA-nicking Smr family endonuclease
MDAAEPPPVTLPVADTLDLHAFAPRDVRSLVVEYLLTARAAGFAEVRLIHGRGHGVQRATVQAAVAALPFVRAAYDAPPDRGGWGATVVVLDPPEATATVPPG